MTYFSSDSEIDRIGRGLLDRSLPKANGHTLVTLPRQYGCSGDLTWTPRATCLD
jgi:hypothetical protein